MASESEILNRVHDATANTLKVSGAVASGSSDSGNPTKIGGVYNSTPPTFTNGQRGDAQINSQGALKSSGDFKEVGSLSVSSLNGDLVPSTDVSEYRSISLLILASTFSGTLTFQASNDNSNWVSVIMNETSSTLNNNSTFGGGANRIYTAPINFRYFRVRATSYSSGTATGVLELYALPNNASNLMVAATQQGVWTPSLIPTTSGGLSKFHLVSAATTNATNVKASAGQVYGWSIGNTNAAARYVKFHNTAGTPTAGTAVTDAILIPASGTSNIEFTNGITFSTGIAITTVTGAADSDSTGVGLNDLVINIYYK